jgi:hypothetical protein
MRPAGVDAQRKLEVMDGNKESDGTPVIGVEELDTQHR